MIEVTKNDKSIKERPVEKNVVFPSLFASLGKMNNASPMEKVTKYIRKETYTLRTSAKPYPSVDNQWV